MRRFSVHSLLYWFAMLSVMASPAVAMAATMEARLGNEQIYLGTQTTMIVNVQGAGKTEWPKIEHTEGLNIRHYRGPRTVRNLFSGQTTRQYQFLVTPQRTGSFKIPAVYLETDEGKLEKGPFRLVVHEAELKFHGLQLEPQQVMPGESAELVLQYKGYYPDDWPTIPEVKGLSIRASGEPEIRLDRGTGIPFTFYKYKISAALNGTYRIQDAQLKGVTADSASLVVSPYVIEGTQVRQSSVVLGEQTQAYVFIRGLPEDADVRLIAPQGIEVEKADEKYRSRSGSTVFAFNLKPQEPGSFSIRQLRLPDGKKSELPEQIVVSARRAGKGGILSCKGKPRKQEVVVGEPFILDCEVVFRGDLQAASIDSSEAGFAQKDYIKVEPVEDLTYPDWQGSLFQGGFTNRAMGMLAGTGEFNGQSEQMLRFALRITPLAAGKLNLDGLSAVLRLQVRQVQQSGFSRSVMTSLQDYAETVEAPPITVLDPPGVATPDGYRGAVGSAFRFSTSLDRTRATAMSPITLTMTIEGSNVTSELNPPPLGEVEDLTRQFEVSSIVNGGEVQGHSITFTQVIRPRSPEVKKVPSLPFVFYDYKSKEYKTVYSLPIPIEVLPGRVVGAEGMETNNSSTQTAANKRTTSGKDKNAHDVPLAANYTEIGELHTYRPFSTNSIVGILLAGPLAIGILGSGYALFRRLRPGREERRQRKQLVQSAESALQAENPHAELARVFQDYLRLRFNLPAGELSHDTLKNALGDKETKLEKEITGLLDELNAGRFSTSTIDVEEKQKLVHRTQELMNRLEQ